MLIPLENEYPKRGVMNLHEYQAKQILLQYGINVPPFEVVSTLADVEKLVHEKNWSTAVLKIQIHAGGRGKAGGVLFAKSADQILNHAKILLGKKFVNQQTGPQGLVAHQLLLTPPIEIAKEYYLAVTVSRERGERILIASPVGGMDIEQVAQESPELVLMLTIPSEGRLRHYQLIRLAKFMGWTGEQAIQGNQLANKLIQAFMDKDAVLLEINPLVETPDKTLVALDAKLSVDDNALFRQPEIKAMFDPTQVPEQEAQAQQYDLAYVALDGEIGCMVNGAGLAMATMDIIQAYGKRPANFLDVGGSATQEKVAEGFKIILSDSQVKAILINIFGGIMNCEILALGIVQAVQEQHVAVPLVVRMEGTHVDQGKRILQEAKLNIQIATSLAGAARAVVEKCK